ncbi:metal-dependent transcriptional regulator [Clostridioides difficile]|uniref:Metal-dependent transcriptional regulator n=2 Tax=Bacillota TaxID=1239 RepID=A0A552US46_9FIRM|nr:metal-dependent transcriptional regulator [Criibacterium bergeronii]MBH7306549.1 metal-dependent transcriptional regulator [Clostridioides difficile]MBU5669999.1 metal-dependent transcriptional regulator [Peptoniphilus ovalis]HAP5741913.1 metal-dependent transcriptional regulator [Enterococcus faecalis]HEO2858997.1 metal-dependent transcriptional regulator [Streptococcus agalactiae]MCW0664094.1 metal-dependent transcriptional regulator [Clostridioides difficile]
MLHREFAEENYLEAIYILSLGKDEVRNMDLANYLEYKRPTVTRMLKKLENKGLIIYGEDKIIRLTEESKTFCKKMYTRHKYLTDVFIRLGIDAEKAENEACLIEHVISDETFEKLKKHFDYNL